MTLVSAGTIQTIIPEVMAYELIYTRGKNIDASMITPRDWEAIDSHIATEPPPECASWRGKAGETCGECRYGNFTLTPRGYPHYRVRLPGKPEEKQCRRKKTGELYKRKVYPSMTVTVGRLIVVRQYGSIAWNRVAGHKCPCGEKKLCLTPSHLEPMTPLENFLRIRLNGHHDPALKAMISAVMGKLATGNYVLTEREERIYRAIMMGMLGLNESGEVDVNDPANVVEEGAEVQLDPGDIPF